MLGLVVFPGSGDIGMPCVVGCSWWARIGGFDSGIAIAWYIGQESNQPPDKEKAMFKRIAAIAVVSVSMAFAVPSDYSESMAVEMARAEIRRLSKELSKAESERRARYLRHQIKVQKIILSTVGK